MSGYLKWLCNNKTSAERIVEPELSHWVTELNLETGGERPFNDEISANQKPQKSSLPTDGEIRKLGVWAVYKVRNSHIRHSRAGRALLCWRKERGRLWVQLASAVQAS